MMRVGSSGLDRFHTAIEQKYEQQRLIGIADAMRLLGGDDRALQKLVLAWPQAAQYVPIGSRPGEEKQGKFEYRCGAVMYWRPGNYYQADSVWLIEP